MRWRSAKAEMCAVCESTDRLVLHRVVYQQHVRKARGDCADPDNSLTLCWRCLLAMKPRRTDQRPGRTERVHEQQGMIWLGRFGDAGDAVVNGMGTIVDFAIEHLGLVWLATVVILLFVAL